MYIAVLKMEAARALILHFSRFNPSHKRKKKQKNPLKGAIFDP
jgi:hypothetical protein